MARILRGDIVWADLNPVRGHEQAGQRPVVVISEDVFNARLAPRPAANEFEMVVGLKEKLQPAVSRIEREMIRLALQDHQSNLDAAARALGISRKGLYLKRQRLGL